MEQEEDHRSDHTSQGKINIKTPSPGDFGGEGATHQRAEYGRDTKDGTKETLVLGPLVEWDCVDHDDDLMCRSVSDWDGNDESYQNNVNPSSKKDI